MSEVAIINNLAVRKFYEHLSDNEFAKIGREQWQTLRNLEAHYDTMPMSEFYSVPFSSNRWPVEDGGDYLWDKMY